MQGDFRHLSLETEHLHKIDAHLHEKEALANAGIALRVIGSEAKQPNHVSERISRMCSSRSSRIAQLSYGRFLSERQ